MTNQIAALLIEGALKSSAVFAIAFAADWFARRRSSEERHLVFAFALMGLLALPVLAAIGPQVEVPIRGMMAGAGGVAQGEPGTARSVSGGTTDAPDSAERSPATAPVIADEDAPGFLDGRLSEAVAIVGRWSAAKLAVAVYSTIALLLLLYVAATASGVAFLLRRLAAVTDASLLALFEETRIRLGLRRRVRLKVSQSDHTPWAWGVFRPVVVIPESFSRLSAESQRDAMVHELSHVARLDFLTMLLGCVCCALYWFQPLAWLALRRMARASELACDDRVLLAGSRRTAYAAQLLAVARAIHRRGRRPAPATAMAGSSAVSRRIASILDLDIRRTTVSKFKVCSLSILTALLIVPFASLKSQESATAAVSDPADAQVLALVQRGPENGDELSLIVRALVAKGMQADAVDAVADYVSRDVAEPADPLAGPWCELCSDVLKDGAGGSNGSDLLPTVLAAFDEVENRARTAVDGDLLIRLAVISGADGPRGATGRGTFYLVEGFRLGHLSDASKLDAIELLNDMGWYPQAKDLAERLYNDASSNLHQSSAVKTWIKRLDFKIEQRNSISRRLLTPDASFSYTDDVAPVYRVAPVYPATALRQHREASVRLEFTITELGRTEGITVISSTDNLFNGSAVESISQWRYLPQVVDGAAVEKTGVRTVIKFRLMD